MPVLDTLSGNAKPETHTQKSMNISISKSQIAALIEESKREVVAQLITESSNIRLLTQTQTAALLDVTTATLQTLDLKPIILAPTKTVRYALSDIQQYIQNNYVTAK